MGVQASTSMSPEGELAGWTKIGIACGFVACFVYPIMVLVSLPRIPQLILGASFGPALAVASVALAHVLHARRRSPSLELAAIFNSLAGALVTAMIVVQLAINYSTAPLADEQLSDALRLRYGMLSSDLTSRLTCSSASPRCLFAVNMMRDPRFGKIVGWAGVVVSVVPLLGANIYYFPDPPYTHGFPHVGIFTGLWYLAVVLLMVRWVYRGGMHARAG